MHLFIRLMNEVNLFSAVHLVASLKNMTSFQAGSTYKEGFFSGTDEYDI